MALFELVTTIFLLSTLLSLMRKKRASTDEAGPSCLTCTRKKTGNKASTSVERERRSKQDLNLRIPIERSLSAGVKIEEESEEDEGSEDEEDNDEEYSEEESTEEGNDGKEQEEEEEAQDADREPPTATHGDHHDLTALEARMAQIEEN
ncbi:histone acetyltransferase GCN5-like [Magnolia sinica]|uniref:histone acetyltransferase GCN5-like n=1 Tax=Magnolia sinica TaxID=86752 RepID=UPI0026590B57|nr:histone acetyltransferase GCN5-like [Magnolia sinica]